MAEKLTALRVKSLTRPGRYGDGGGLWLQVRGSDRRSWLFRYTLNGKARQMGLGPAGDVSLAEARNAAQEARRLVREGSDPIERRIAAKRERRDAAKAITFNQVVERYIGAHEPTWRNAQHRYQWRQTLGLAGAAFGDQPVAAISIGHVMGLLEPLWPRKPETASRLRGRIEAVLDYAAARGWRTGDNPARWRGHLAKLLPSARKVAPVKHHPALPWSEIGSFVAAVRAEKGVAARALEFTILTAGRTGEVIGARWSEISLESGIWVVPPERMKAGREHRVPLAPAAMTVLQSMLPGRDPAARDWVFPGSKPGKPLSNMAMMMLLRRMGRGDLSVHGLRSTFRDWCSEFTNTSREVAQAALAHAISDAVERAYRRGDLFEKRRRLMEAWATFCARKFAEAGDVVSIRRSAIG